MNFKAIMNNRWLDLLKRSLSGWMDDKALRLSAALAYYSIFSIAPLLVITIGIAGLVLGEKAVSDQLYGELKGYMGAQSAEAIQSMVQSASKPSQGVMATVLGFVMLIVGASGSRGLRVAEVTPRARTLPALIMGMVTTALLNSTWMWPPARSDSAAAPPL